MKTGIIFILSLLIFSCEKSQIDNYSNNDVVVGGLNSTSTNFIGDWRISCEEGSGYIQVLSLDSIFIEINSNQIYVISKGVIKKNILYVYLVAPGELGMGGMNLNWNNFSRNEPIAELLFKKKDAELKWKGFYNTKKLKYEWVEGPDWFLGNYKNRVLLKNCNDL